MKARRRRSKLFWQAQRYRRQTLPLWGDDKARDAVERLLAFGAAKRV